MQFATNNPQLIDGWFSSTQIAPAPLNNDQSFISGHLWAESDLSGRGGLSLGLSNQHKVLKDAMLVMDNILVKFAHTDLSRALKDALGVVKGLLVDIVKKEKLLGEAKDMPKDTEGSIWKWTDENKTSRSLLTSNPISRGRPVVEVLGWSEYVMEKIGLGGPRDDNAPFMVKTNPKPGQDPCIGDGVVVQDKNAILYIPSKLIDSLFDRVVPPGTECGNSLPEKMAHVLHFVERQEKQKVTNEQLAKQPSREEANQRPPQQREPELAWMVQKYLADQAKLEAN
jgi:hypothetical protein